MRDDGFTLVEALVALVLTLVVTTAALALLNPNQLVVQAHAESLDMQQRLRVAADALQRDLTMAGAGLDAGPRIQTGSLLAAFAPILPRRIGLTGADDPLTARADAISIMYVPTTLSQTTTSAAAPTAAGLAVDPASNCPAGEPVCGLQPGMAIALFDDAGRYDVFSVTRVRSDAAEIQPHDQGLSYVYPPGTHVTEIDARSFYLDAAAAELRQYDGYLTDVPVADNVVGLTFEYFGDPAPPVSPKPPDGEENCLYDAAGNLKAASWLGSSTGELVALPLPSLSDGPWCGTGNTVFDADLLRVRTVRVTLRVQAALPAFRATGVGFVRPGTSRSSLRSLPDLVATWAVSPHNMSAGR